MTEDEFWSMGATTLAEDDFWTMGREAVDQVAPADPADPLGFAGIEPPEQSMRERMLAEEEARKDQGIDPYQYNVALGAEMGLENDPRGAITGSVPARAIESAVSSFVNKTGGFQAGLAGKALGAVGLDSASDAMNRLHDVAQGNLDADAAQQAILNKRGLFGETLTSWLHGGAAALGESALAGASFGGLPGMASYFGLSTYDRTLDETGSHPEAFTQGAIEGVFSYLGGKVLGAGTGRLAQKFGGGAAGETLGGKVAEQLSKKFPIPRWGAEAVGAGGAEVIQEAATEGSQYLADVAFGREKWSPERFVERVKAVVGPSLVAGGLGGGLSAGVDSWAKKTAEALDARQKELPKLASATTTQGTPVQRAPEQATPPQPQAQPTQQTQPAQAERPVFDPNGAESWTASNPDAARAVANRVAGGQKLTRGDLEKIGVPNANGSSKEQRAEFGRRVQQAIQQPQGSQNATQEVQGTEVHPGGIPGTPQGGPPPSVPSGTGQAGGVVSVPEARPQVVQEEQPSPPSVVVGQQYIGMSTMPGRLRNGVHERGKSKPYPEQEQPMVATEEVRTRKVDKMFGGDVTERKVITGTGRAMWLDERDLQPIAPPTTESEAPDERQQQAQEVSQEAQTAEAGQESLLTEPQPPAAPGAVAAEPDFLDDFEDDFVSTERPPLNNKERQAVHRELARMRRKGSVSADVLDELDALNPSITSQLIAEAGERAQADNEDLSDLRSEFDTLFGTTFDSNRARLAERQGGDATNIPGFDEKVQQLENLPALRAEAYARGEGNLESGLLDILRGGKKQFASRSIDDYIEDSLEAYHATVRRQQESTARPDPQVSEPGPSPQQVRGDGAQGASEDDFALSRAGSPDTSPVVEPYRVPESERLPSAPAERQPNLAGMPADMEPGTLRGQQGLFEQKPDVPPLAKEVHDRAKSLIQKAFPSSNPQEDTLKVTLDGTTEVVRAFRIELPNGKQLWIDHTRKAIAFDKQKVARDYGVNESRLEGGVAQGIYHPSTTHTGLGVIRLLEDFDAGTLAHEQLHALFDLVYTEAERQQILKRYKTEERAAEAFRRRQGFSKGLGDRLLQFIDRLRTFVSGDVFPGNKTDSTAAQSLQETADAVETVSSPGFGLGGFAGRKQRQPTVHPSVQANRPEVEERLQKAHGTDRPSLLGKIEAAAQKAWHVTTRTREHLPNTRQFDTARELLRLMDASQQASADEANRTIAAILDPLDESAREIFERKIVVDNLRSAIERGQPLRFGFKDPQEVAGYQAKVDAAVSQNPHIQRAIDGRKKVVEELVNDLVDNGLLSEGAKDNAESYFHQQVLSYVESSKRAGIRPQKIKRGFQKKRVVGPPELEQLYDYNTNYLEAEAEWMTDAQVELRKEKLLRQLEEEYDQMPGLRAEAKAKDVPVEQLMRERTDLGVWQPAPGNVFYRTFTIPEKVAEEILRIAPQEVDAGMLRQALAMGGPRKQLALPSELVDQLDSMQKPKPKGWIADIARTTMDAWKVWTLLNPKRAIGYMVRNLTGDIDPVLGARPQALRYTNRAIRELWGYHSGKLALTPELRKARDLGVIGSSITAQEIPSLKDLPVFRRVYQRTTKATEIPAEALEKIKEFNEFREGILRYAAFLDYRKELAGGTLKDYGGANPNTVAVLRKTLGDDVAAAHLARNLLGDYGNITVLGQFLRSYVIPFYSWIEVNAKRWPRLAQNAYVAGNITSGGRVAGTVAVGSLYLARLGTMHALMAAWNHLMFPDEEKELGPNERANPHLTMGRRPDNSIRILRNTGALGDFLEWFGLNTAVSAWPQYESGQLSTKELLQMMAKDPLNKVVQGIGPHLKVPFEALAGQAFFPDATNPQPMPRDEILANAVSLRDEYRAAKGAVLKQGDRARPNYLESFLGVGTVDPRREVLSEIYALRERFLDRKGKPSVNVLKVSDFRPMREAAYANDYDAFKEARKAFLEKGKAFENFMASIEHLDPIAARLNDAEEQEFEQEFLEGNQRLRLKLARDYADELRATLLSWWWEAAQESGSAEEITEVRNLTRKRKSSLRKTAKPPENITLKNSSSEARKRRGLARKELQELNAAFP
jgi:hypothetical protein